MTVDSTNRIAELFDEAGSSLHSMSRMCHYGDRRPGEASELTTNDEGAQEWSWVVAWRGDAVGALPDGSWTPLLLRDEGARTLPMTEEGTDDLYQIIYSAFVPQVQTATAEFVDSVREGGISSVGIPDSLKGLVAKAVARAEAHEPDDHDTWARDLARQMNRHEPE